MVLGIILNYYSQPFKIYASAHELFTESPRSLDMYWGIRIHVEGFN